MEEENTPEIKESAKETNLKFSLWFYIAITFCALVFIIVSAVTGKVSYWAAALGFGVFVAEFIRLFIKSKRILILVVAIVCAAATALLFTLWIMRLIGMG